MNAFGILRDGSRVPEAETRIDVGSNAQHRGPREQCRRRTGAAGRRVLGEDPVTGREEPRGGRRFPGSARPREEERPATDVDGRSMEREIATCHVAQEGRTPHRRASRRTASDEVTEIDGSPGSISYQPSLFVQKMYRPPTANSFAAKSRNGRGDHSRSGSPTTSGGAFGVANQESVADPPARRNRRGTPSAPDSRARFRRSRRFLQPVPSRLLRPPLRRSQRSIMAPLQRPMDRGR